MLLLIDYCLPMGVLAYRPLTRDVMASDKRSVLMAEVTVHTFHYYIVAGSLLNHYIGGNSRIMASALPGFCFSRHSGLVFLLCMWVSSLDICL